jgi:hypothetical protein
MARPPSPAFFRVALATGEDPRHLRAQYESESERRALAAFSEGGPLWRVRKVFLELVHERHPAVLDDLWGDVLPAWHGDRDEHVESALLSWARRHRLEAEWVLDAAARQLEVWNAIDDMTVEQVRGIGWARWPSVVREKDARPGKARRLSRRRTLEWLVRWTVGGETPDHIAATDRVRGDRPGEKVRQTLARVARDVGIPAPPTRPRGRPRRVPCL